MVEALHKVRQGREERQRETERERERERERWVGTVDKAKGDMGGAEREREERD